MIRDAHDFRAGIHDRLLRKLTGRSYSALVHPVARDFPLARRCAQGDVFFHNDVYRSEGGIGHLPDLCVTVPVFSDGEVVAFVQAFGHHDDIGGCVPGSMPSAATTVFEEGLMVPPIKLWDAGVPNEVRADDHDPQLADARQSLAADLDAECSACLMGARRLGELFDRYGRDAVEACFDAIIDRTTADLPPRDPLQDPGRHLRLGGLRRARRRRRAAAAHPADHADQDAADGRSRRRAADPRLRRHVPQAKGPINHCGDYADGNFLKKWLAPILRNLADTSRADGRARRQRGRRAADRDAVPAAGHAAHADLPGADQRPHVRDPAAARRARRGAGQGRRRPDAGRPGDDPLHRGVRRRPPTASRYLHARGARRRLRAGATTPTARTPSTSCPTRGTSRRSSPRAGSRSWSRSSAWPWTPAAPGEFRGGLGYEKHIRMLKDANFMSIADRSILACWG